MYMYKTLRPCLQAGFIVIAFSDIHNPSGGGGGGGGDYMYVYVIVHVHVCDTINPSPPQPQHTHTHTLTHMHMCMYMYMYQQATHKPRNTVAVSHTPHSTTVKGAGIPNIFES